MRRVRLDAARDEIARSARRPMAARRRLGVGRGFPVRTSALRSSSIVAIASVVS